MNQVSHLSKTFTFPINVFSIWFHFPRKATFRKIYIFHFYPFPYVKSLMSIKDKPIFIKQVFLKHIHFVHLQVLHLPITWLLITAKGFPIYWHIFISYSTKEKSDFFFSFKDYMLHICIAIQTQSHNSWFTNKWRYLPFSSLCLMRKIPFLHYCRLPKAHNHFPPLELF